MVHVVLLSTDKSTIGMAPCLYVTVHASSPWSWQTLVEIVMRFLTDGGGTEEVRNVRSVHIAKGSSNADAMAANPNKRLPLCCGYNGQLGDADPRSELELPRDCRMPRRPARAYMYEHEATQAT